MQSKRPFVTSAMRKALEGLDFHETPEDAELVRTTFRLSQGALSARERFANYIDAGHVDVMALVARTARSIDLGNVLKHLPESTPRDVRRTTALSRASLRVIEDTAELLGIHRDLVVESILRFFGSMAKEEAAELVERHSAALPILLRLRASVEDTSEHLLRGLGPDDPVTERLAHLAVRLDRLLQEIDEERAGGDPVRSHER